MQKTAIKNWLPDDQPREKLFLKGAETLSNAELLAILINTGNKSHTAIEIARYLLEDVHNNLQTLAKMTVTEILNLKIHGIGKSKAVAIRAALELGVRKNMTVHKKLRLNRVAMWLRICKLS